MAVPNSKFHMIRGLEVKIFENQSVSGSFKIWIGCPGWLPIFQKNKIENQLDVGFGGCQRNYPDIRIPEICNGFEFLYCRT